MATGPRAAIPAPPNRQARTGLIPLANRPTDIDDRWENGFAFAPEACGDGQARNYGCGPTDEKFAPENPDLVSYDPVALVGGDECSTLDNDRDATERAERHLRAIESYQLERVLWTGLWDPEPGDEVSPRPHLADGNAQPLNDGNPASRSGGFVLLDQALTACLHGGQGMVHMTPGRLTWFAHLQLVFFEGGRWVTPNGHIVVAGSGYTGGGPRPAPDQPLPPPPDLLATPAPSQWIYGTGMVQVLLGAAETLSDVDRSVNTRTVLRERPAAAYWGCCQFAVHIES